MMDLTWWFEEKWKQWCKFCDIAVNMYLYRLPECLVFHIYSQSMPFVSCCDALLFSDADVEQWGHFRTITGTGNHWVL